MKAMLFGALALSLVAVPATAASNVSQKSGEQGRKCVSGGATADNPGQWLQKLREISVFEGMSPAEMAEMENSTLGWAGYGKTPNVGAFIDFFCEGGHKNG